MKLQTRSARSSRLLLAVICLLALGATTDSCEIDDPGPGPPSRDPVANLQQQLDELAPQVVPAGLVLAFAGPRTGVPAGFLLCDGSTLDRIQFADLFAEIGTSHGEGDGSSSFHLPDYRGRFLRGVDAGTVPPRDPQSASRTAMASGGNTGESVGSLQGWATAMPAGGLMVSSDGQHVHSTGISGWFHSHSIVTTGTLFTPGSLLTDNGDSKGDEFGTPRFNESLRTDFDAGHAHGMDPAGSHTHSIAPPALETQPVNAYVNWIISF